MPHNLVLEDFLSRDPQRIWSASGVVRSINERAFLEPLAIFVDQIEAATKGIDLGGGLMPNSAHLNFALCKLRHVLVSAECLCNFFLGDSLASPELAARRGQIEISREAPNSENYSYLYWCRCLQCGNTYEVEEIGGYHYPWYKWSRDQPE